jgi:hypothetical protein
MKLLLLITAIFTFFIALTFKFISKRKIQIWLPSYCTQILSKAFTPPISNKPVHILFCFVDHFEPGWNKADWHLERERVDGWLEKYPDFAGELIDSDGVHPRHTWFYPPHYFREEHILKLLKLCKQGFGEIEMHLHHNRMEPFPDTSETLRKKIIDCIELYSQYGIFKTTVNEKPQIRYAFIHGDWALDNSRNGYCGVNDEISILGETGCYADFTFPAYMIESQPKMINSIYYATDDPIKPKSYDSGKMVFAGGQKQGDLIMVQGPLGFRWKGRRRFFIPSVDDGEISSNNPPSNARIDFWINRGIHVTGRPDWVIAKVFTHGAPVREHSVLLDKPIKSMHAYLQKQYNDGIHYRLHYVSARELYNIIKAAESNLEGNPGNFRDFEISKYDYLINNCH